MSNYNHPSPVRKATVILRNFPRDIRDFFKAYAAKRGTSMKQLIVDFMSDCISRDSQPKKKKGKKHRDG
jgi:hypothetical protein